MARDKKKSGMSLDTDSMIWRAMSLQRAAKELERIQDNSKQDTLLFMGGFIAVPVLLTLATEIALKAWLYREEKETPDRRHDLLDLYDDLGEITRKRLEAKVPEVSHPLPGFPPTYRGIRETLCFHRKIFIRWRYSYENPGHIFHIAEFNNVLTAIIETYEEDTVQGIL